MRASIAFPGIHACESVERSSLRSPDPRHVELRPTRRPRNLEIRTGPEHPPRSPGTPRAAAAAHPPRTASDIPCTRRPRSAAAPERRRADAPRANENRVTSPPHNETMGYRPAAEAIQQRPCVHRKRPTSVKKPKPALAPARSRARSALAAARASPMKSTTPRREFRRSQAVPASGQTDPMQPRNAPPGTHVQSRSTTCCGPSRGAPARLPLARARSARCRVSTVKALGRRATTRPRIRRGSDHPCHRLTHPGYQTGDRYRVSSRH